MLTRNRQPDANSSSATRTANELRQCSRGCHIHARLHERHRDRCGSKPIRGGVAQISDHVAIGIENADFRNGSLREAFLAACFAQKVLGFEGGSGIVVLVRQDRRHFFLTDVFWNLSLTNSIVMQPGLYANVGLD